MSPTGVLSMSMSIPYGDLEISDKQPLRGWFALVQVALSKLKAWAFAGTQPFSASASQRLKLHRETEASAFPSGGGDYSLSRFPEEQEKRVKRGAMAACGRIAKAFALCHSDWRMNEGIRGAGGKFLPGHHIGRPKGRRTEPLAPRPSPVAVAFEAAGTPIEAARKLLVEKLIEGTKAGDPHAMKLLGGLVMPKGRTLDAGLFAGAVNAEQRAAAVVGALGEGVLSPREASEAIGAVRVQAEAGDWAETRALLDAAKAGGARVLPGGSGTWTEPLDKKPNESDGKAANAVIPVEATVDGDGHGDH